MTTTAIVDFHIFLKVTVKKVVSPVYMVSVTTDNPPPPSCPGRTNFSRKSLKDSTNRLYDPARVVSGVNFDCASRDTFFSNKRSI